MGPNAPWGPGGWTEHAAEYILGDPNDPASDVGTFLAARTDYKCGSTGSYAYETILLENFITEEYRLRDHIDRTDSCQPLAGDLEDYPTDCYKTQQDVIDELALQWDKTQDLSDGTPGYKGLMCFLTSLRSPFVTNDTQVVDGNFNDIDYPSGTNADYSGISTSEARWFYRAFQNNSGQSRSTFTVKITGSNVTSYTGDTTQIIPATSPGSGPNNLTGNNIFVEIRIPDMQNPFEGVAESGWLDLAKERGFIGHGGGLLAEGSGYGTGSNHILSGEKTFNCSIGARYILSGNWIVLRIKALSSWNKKIDKIEIVW